MGRLAAARARSGNIRLNRKHVELNMSFNPDDAERLRLLLAFKRREQPPKAYFEHLSRQVIARIQAGEQAPDSPWEALASQFPCLRLFGKISETVAGALGAALCVLLVKAFLDSSSLNPLQAAATTLPSTYASAPALVKTTRPALPAVFQVPGDGFVNLGGERAAEIHRIMFQGSER